MFSIDLRGGAPVYEQIYRRISELIVKGAMQENEKLPAVREVAKELGVNPNTVQKAYQQLEQGGMIYSIPAKGSFVAKGGGAIDAAKKQLSAEFRAAAASALANGLTAAELRTIIDEAEKVSGGEQ